MTKIAFTKLGLKKNEEIKEILWNNQKLEIKQFIPTIDKIDLITKVISFSADDHTFYNPCKLEIVKKVLIILTYTNINVTEKQSEDILKLHDLFVSSGFYDAVVQEIPESELNYIDTGVWSTINEIYRYRDSMHGILNAIAEDYKETDFDVNNIINKITENKEELSALKEITTKLD